MSLVYKFIIMFVFFFKQKTAYEMRISDWSSDVCSSDLVLLRQTANGAEIALNPCIRATQCRDSTIMESRACRQARYSGDRSSQWPSSPLPGSDRKSVV